MESGVRGRHVLTELERFQKGGARHEGSILKVVLYSSMRSSIYYCNTRSTSTLRMPLDPAPEGPTSHGNRLTGYKGLVNNLHPSGGNNV